MSTMLKELLSTGEVASLCSVTPDAVLKWVKTGKISAIKTPGGHFRIPRSAIPKDIVQQTSLTSQTNQLRAFQYCWEFNTRSQLIPQDCRKCVVYRTKARRCYLMSSFPVEVGHVKKYCTESCDDCNYYKQIRNQIYNMLIVTQRVELQTTLKKESYDRNLNLKFADSEYVCSMIIAEFRPDYVVIDAAVGEEQSYTIARHLIDDPRLPTVKLILAVENQEITCENEKDFIAYIHPTFTMFELSELIESMTE